LNDLICVVAIGYSQQDLADTLVLTGVGEWEAQGFSVVQLGSDEELPAVLAQRHVSVILTFGAVDDYPSLHRMSFEVRRRWLHFDDVNIDPEVLAPRVMTCFLGVVDGRGSNDPPLITVFTPAFRSGERILRPYHSLCAQTYGNWEWVVMDDSDEQDLGETFSVLSSLAASDNRVKVFRSHRHSGVIGEVKRWCCGLARGSILVELDHDDELVESCLSSVVEAFDAFPDAGFAYTDCAEVFESGVNATYGETYAFGFGSYREEWHGGRSYMVSNFPDVNAKTARHIVGMPNHVRAWRRDAYWAAGGHSPDVHVADDYELCIRTFLTTRMVHIRRLGYVQFLGDQQENTQRRRNKEIQRLVRYFASHYNDRIHNRLEELGVDDFIWTPTGLDWNRQPGDRPISANYEFA
jgi:glycosyltransferase involved in cell wall biosynthesis